MAELKLFGYELHPAKAHSVPFSKDGVVLKTNNWGLVGQGGCFGMCRHLNTDTQHSSCSSEVLCKSPACSPLYLWLDSLILRVFTT